MQKKIPWAANTVHDRLAAIKKRVDSREPELEFIFTQTFFDQAQQQCNNLDANSTSPLCGAFVSVKDLLDVQGFVTKAGTTFMAEDSPASVDAPTIQQLRDAGAIFVGHTNMTELAYSGLGLNPHYGTPQNALAPGCIPGGSTSGGAVSVARGLADIAIGTDTGGSVRIPAAFNGIVGFKPSQSTVSRTGCKALSRTLDSIGPLAHSVAACELAYKFMANSTANERQQLEQQFVVPSNYGMDDMQPPVKAAFEEAINKLKNGGHKIERKPIAALEALKTFATWQFASVESRAEYNDAYLTRKHLFDPRIVSPTRMGRADEVDAITYRQTLNLRQHLVEQYQDEMGHTILLMPTVPILPPTISSLQDDDLFSRTNIQVLRNTSIANIMDCCSITLPLTHDNATIGVMMTVCGGHDLSLLEAAAGWEQLFESD